MNCGSIKDNSARMAQLNFYDSLSISVRDALSHRISCGTQWDGDSKPTHLPCQSIVNRFYNNLQDPGDCQNTRKSYKTAFTAGWSVGWKSSSLLTERRIAFIFRPQQTNLRALHTSTREAVPHDGFCWTASFALRCCSSCTAISLYAT